MSRDIRDVRRRPWKRGIGVLTQRRFSCTRPPCAREIGSEVMPITGASCAGPLFAAPPDDVGAVLLGELALSVGASSIQRAREFVRRTLGASDVGPSVVDDATLIVSELLTNVALHCAQDGAPDATVKLIAVLTLLRIEVHDGSPLVLARREPREDAESGRGLLVVDALSDRWGYEATAYGKCVWCELTAWPEQTPSQRA